MPLPGHRIQEQMVELAENEINTNRSRITVNTVALVVTGATGMLFSLAQMSVLSRFLTAAQFGLFVALRGFALLLSTVILFGLPQVLVRFLPSFQNRGQRRRALYLFGGSSAVVLLTGMILCYSAEYWKAWIPGNAEMTILTDPVIFWMSLTAVAMALKMLLYGGFSGLREMRAQMLCELFYLVLLTAYVVVRRETLALELLFRVLFFLNLLTAAAGYPVFIRLAARAIGNREETEDRSIIMPSPITYWGSSVLLSFVALAFTDVDRYLMSTLLPVSVISVFHIASRINSLLKRFLGFPVVALQPEVTRIYEEGRGKELKEKIVLFTKVTFIAALYLTALTAVAGKDLILLLSGQAYIGSYRILLILLICVPLAAFIAPLVITMRALHFIKWAVLCDFLWMAVYFGTFFIFVSRWGVPGMAVAQVCATLVQMTGAVLLSKREGFYGGLGKRTGRLIPVFVLLVPAGYYLMRIGGPVFTAAGVLISPFLFKAGLRVLRIFDRSEIDALFEIVSFAPGRKFMAWILSVKEC
ncbi:MAG: lipopolysaccharide biosynthesis protein [Candidatus Krumholzibacteriota bacterium]|nr:lipopolysaccharide biosynthesis protein [Candidatus Krumholzibacteriota bacterium]